MKPSVWKSIAELENCDGVLFVDGCDVRQLARDYGTPLYVYSKNRIQHNYQRLINAYRAQYPLTSIKNGYKKFVGLDAGMHTLLRPALYDAYHHILYANDLYATADVNVVGQVCENSDIFAKDRPLSSKIAVDDLLVFLNTGAYGYCMSSQYNSQSRPAEVLVDKGSSPYQKARNI